MEEILAVLLKVIITLTALGAAFLAVLTVNRLLLTRNRRLMSIILAVVLLTGSVLIWSSSLSFVLNLALSLAGGLVTLAIVATLGSSVRPMLSGWLATAAFVISGIAVWFTSLEWPMYIIMLIALIGLLIMIFVVGTIYDGDIDSEDDKKIDSYEQRSAHYAHLGVYTIIIILTVSILLLV